MSARVRIGASGWHYKHWCGQLREWAHKIRRWGARLKDIYVYFDNDQAAYAAQNALELKRLVGARAAASPSRRYRAIARTR